MTFLNAALLWGVVGIAIPLILHWLFRRRFRQLDWGAMPLLRRVVRSSRRRLRWHQWILLLIRCAAVALLAIAMARPLAWSWSGTPSDSPLSLVIVIDDSRSMQAAGRDQRAVEAALSLIDALGERDEVLLMRAAGAAADGDASARFVSPLQTRRSLVNWTFDDGPIDWNGVLQRALAASRRANHPHRRVVLVSDFQDIAKRRMPSRRPPRDDDPPGGSQRTEIDMLSVADPNDSLANVFVESIRVVDPVVQAGRPVTFEASIRNDSAEPVRGAAVHWQWASLLQQHQRVTVPPQGLTTVRWTVVPRNPGMGTAQIELDYPDALAADNRRRLKLVVLDRVSAWLVDGDPSPNPLESETGFLRLALAPFDDRSPAVPNRAGSGNWINVSVYTPQQCRQALSELAADGDEDDGPDAPSAIVLTNIRSPQSIGPELAEQYVDRGGAIVFFDGDQVDPEAWSGSPLLVRPLGEATATTSSDDAMTRLLSGNLPAPESPRPEPFTSGASAVEARFQIRRRRQAADTTAQPDRARYKVVWQTGENEPLMWRGRMSGAAPPAGDDKSAGGELVQWSISADDEWSTLPLQPAWVPLMQQMIRDLVQPPIPGRAVTAVPGNGVIPNSGPSVDAPAEESRLAVDGEAAARQAAKTIGASWFADPADLTKRLDIDRYGRELAGAAFAGLLVLLAAELAWQQRVGKAA